MSTRSIFQSEAQNILTDATITSDVAPLTTGGYSLDLLNALRPDWNIKWNVSTVTITWTLSSPARGDVFVLPKSNLTTGHATLTNGAGLSQALTIPSLQANGLSKTTAIDLTLGTPNPTTRTSNVWHLVIASNPVSVTLGAAVAVYNPRTLFIAGGFLMGVTYTKKTGTLNVANWNLGRFKLSSGATERGLVLSALSSDADAVQIEDFFDGCAGDAYPGTVWLNPDTDPDAYLGYWSEGGFSRTRKEPNVNDIKLTFTELSKGIKLL